MEGYARWFHVSLGVGEGLCCVWSRLSTVLEGFLDLCFSGEKRKSRHKHSSNLKKLIIESACAQNRLEKTERAVVYSHLLFSRKL